MIKRLSKTRLKKNKDKDIDLEKARQQFLNQWASRESPGPWELSEEFRRWRLYARSVMNG